MSLGLSLSSRSRLAPHVLAALAAEGDQAGFAWVFTNELGNDALVTSALFATATRRATIATGIANMFLRHPVLVAAGALTLAGATGGRFVLGLGTSHQQLVGDQLAIPMDRPLARLREYVQVVRALVADGVADFTGRYYTVRGAAMHVPYRLPVPVYVAALGLKAARLAGEIADGVILNFATPEHVGRAVAAVREGERAAGRPAGSTTVVCFLQTMLVTADNADDARRAAQQILARYGRWEFYRAMFAASGYVREAAAIERATDDAETEAAVSDALIRGVMLYGTPEECAARIADYRAVGVDLPVVYPNAPTGQWEDAMRAAIAAFARYAADAGRAQ